MGWDGCALLARRGGHHLIPIQVGMELFNWSSKLEGWRMAIAPCHTPLPPVSTSLRYSGRGAVGRGAHLHGELLRSIGSCSLSSPSAKVSGKRHTICQDLKRTYLITLLFYQIEPLKNGPILVLPSSLSRYKIFQFLWRIVEGRANRAQPSQPILKNCQNGTFFPVDEIWNFFGPNDFIWSAMKVPFCVFIPTWLMRFWGYLSAYCDFICYLFCYCDH